MHRIAIVGSGKIGSMICDLLFHCGDYQVTVIDQSQMSLKRLARQYKGIETAKLDATCREKMSRALRKHDAVINAGPFTMSIPIAEAALASKIHYLDLTEDVESTRAIMSLSLNSDKAFIPQCGLAPGFISIIANHIASQFDQIHNIHMRVGALPQFPSNSLKYNLTWSTDGLINEYLNPCEAIVNGTKREVRPLEELEHFSLDGADYEAFNTSGGLGTLCESFIGRVDNLNYRTVRYPGHRDAMKLLLQDLRLGEDPELMKQILERAIPLTLQDLVLIFVNVSGNQQGKYVQESFVRKIYHQEVNNQARSAIQITTASSICAVLDLLMQGKITQKGFVKQEDIKFDDFIANRFGKVYEGSKIFDAMSASSESGR